MKPNLTAFCHTYRARLCNSQNHGAGWVTFSHRRIFRLVGEFPDSQKGLKTKFGFLDHTHGWNFKTSFDIDPKLEEFNNSVPICNHEEAIIINYAKMRVELVRKPVLVQINWMPKRMDFRNELVLSTYDISLEDDVSSKSTEHNFEAVPVLD